MGEVSNAPVLGTAFVVGIWQTVDRAYESVAWEKWRGNGATIPIVQSVQEGFGWAQPPFLGAAMFCLPDNCRCDCEP